MKRTNFVIYLFLYSFLYTQAQEMKSAGMVYPKTRTELQSDDYFGTKVMDPYRWLENSSSTETTQWIKDQNDVTEKYLSGIPYRKYCKERLTELWDFARMKAPFKEGGKLFYFKNTGLQEQDVLFMQQNDNSEAVVLLDPNKLSQDGTVAVTEVKVSKDAKYLAYSVSSKGSDWNIIYIMDIAKKKVLKDELKWVKFSKIAWKGNGFYYSCYPEPLSGNELTAVTENQKVYYHEVETAQSKDKIVYQNKDNPKSTYQVNVSSDGKYLIISESEGSNGNMLYYKDLTKENQEFKLMFKNDNYTHKYDYIGMIKDNFLVKTNLYYPDYSLVSTDPKTDSPGNSSDFLHFQGMVIESACVAQNFVLVNILANASNILKLYTYDAVWINDIRVPSDGTIESLNGKPGDHSAYFTFSSFTMPPTVYEFDFDIMAAKEIFSPVIKFNSFEYITDQVFYKSSDSTTIPMFIIHKADVPMDGKNPALLVGYGGFNVSLTPKFNPNRLLFLENGGILAVANIRGGGELGESWHKGGMRELKQNSFDDFIAAARFLFAKGYTNASRLAITGSSNGGLLVGACMNQAPELFKVALPSVGLMDMLRYHKFTVGNAWKSEYMTSDDEKGFNVLFKYSPLQNIKKAKYPATLVTTGDHDDRVVPAHSYKYIATLQVKNIGEKPTLIRTETNAGHGMGKPISKIIQEAADVWSFTFFNLECTPEGYTNYKAEPDKK